MSEAVKTVNVVSLNDEQMEISSFNDNEAGVNEAKEQFVAILKSSAYNLTDEEINDFLTEGYYEQGTYQLFIVHG